MLTEPELTDTEADSDGPSVTSEPDTPTVHRTFPWAAVIGGTLLAACAAMLMVWWGLRHIQENSAVTPTDLVSGSANSPVKITGEFERGKPAPAVTFTYLNGQPGSLSDFAGKPIVINFWASTCVPCRTEMPTLEAAYQSMGSTVAFLGVDVGESVEAGEKMVASTGVTYPQIRDPKGTLLSTFGATALPHTVVIGADGTVNAIHTGVLETGDLESLLGAS